MFFANACADSSENAPGQPVALLLGPARRLLLRRAQQIELGDGDGAGGLGDGRRLRHRLQVGRQRLRRRLRIGQTSLGQTGGAGGAGRACHVPGKADGETGGEADDHSEDHAANVTMGCVDNGDHPLPLRGALGAAR